MTLLGLILLIIGLIIGLKVLIWVGGVLLAVGLIIFLVAAAGAADRHWW